LRSRPEHAPINRRPHWPIYQLSPPPKVQTERNLQNSRLNPAETSSLVDLERRIPAKCAFFHSADERIPKTEDSLAERAEFELTGDLPRSVSHQESSN
jgi:hypothetical protein